MSPVSIPTTPESPTHESVRYDVAIIGAGFSGSLVAVHLLQQADTPISVALIDRPECFGQGLAYSTSSPDHLLNVPAGKMGAFPDDPEHFFRWLNAHPEITGEFSLHEVTRTMFVPRMLYGRYIRSLLENAEQRSGRLTRLYGDAADVQPLVEGAMRVELADGRRLLVRKVVLAIGNFPPGDPRLRDPHFHRSSRYLRNPWSSETRETLSAPGDVLILGSGLTALDLLVSLSRTKREGTIHVISRRGLFPQPHRPYGDPRDPFAGEFAARPLRKVAQLVRTEVRKAAREGVDWRAVIDGLRPWNQKLWKSFSVRERRQFLRHLRPYWESHRHRASPDILALKAAMEADGRLRCQRGRVQSIIEEGAGMNVAFSSGDEGPSSLRVKYVVNCTGPESNYHRLRDPLVIQLFARGLIRPDPLFLGLDTTDDGSLYNARGEVFPHIVTLGSPMKGQLFETTAVPELRGQAKLLAERLLRELPASKAVPSEEVHPDPAYSYEI